MLVLLVVAFPLMTLVALVMAASAQARLRRVERREREAQGRIARLAAQVHALERRLGPDAPRPPAVPVEEPRAAVLPATPPAPAATGPGPAVPAPAAPSPPATPAPVETPAAGARVWPEIAAAGGGPPPTPDLDGLLARLGGLPAEAREAVDALVAIGPGAVEALRRVAEEGTEDARADARRALSRILGRPPAPPPPRRASPPAAPRASLEERIGAHWFSWIGMLALLFGVGYLIKYARDQGWISPALQVFGGLALGALLLVAGQVAWRRRYAVLAQGLWGGGIGVLHLVLFAGNRVYDVLTPGTAFVGMVLTTLAGSAISVLHRSRSTITLTAVGGYLTPLLLATDAPDPVFLFTYLSILSAGLLAVGLACGWRFLALGALGADLLYLGAWTLDHGFFGQPFLLPTFLALHVLFSAEPVAWSLLRRRVLDAGGAAMLALDAGLLLAPLVLLVDERHPDLLGLFLLAASLGHLGAALLVRRRHPADDGLVAACGAVAGILFLLVPALAEQPRAHLVPVTWALQALVLLEVVRRGGGRLAWAFVLAALTLAAGRLLAVDTPRRLAHVEPWRLLLNARVLAYGVVIVAYAAACAASRREERRPAAPGATRGMDHLARTAFTWLWIVATALPAVLLTLEVRQAFDVWVAPRFADRAPAYAQVTACWTTVVLAGYATLLTLVAGRRGALRLRNLGLVLGTLVVGKWLLNDLSALGQPATTLLLNARFAAGASLALGLAFVARELERPTPAVTAAPGAAPGLRVAANLIVLLALGLEAYDAIAARAPAGALRDAELLALPVLGALHGLALLAWTRGREGTSALAALGLALAATAGLLWAGVALATTAEPAAALLLDARTAAAALAAAAVFLAARRGGVAPRGAAAGLTVEGHVVVLLALALEGIDLFRRHALDWTVDAPVSVVNGAAFVVVGLLAVHGAALVLAGLARDRPVLRALGLVFLGLAVLGVVGAQAAADPGHARHLLLNTRALLAGLGVPALLLAAGAYRRRGPGLAQPLPLGGRRTERDLRAPLALVGHALAVTLLTLEARDVFSVEGGEDLVPSWLELRHARQLAYSLIWAMYGIGMVVAGFVRGFKPMRLMALLLLLVTVVKVFLLDLSFLDNPYRILSFVALGLILVGVSWLYQRYREVLVG